jgi:cytoskeleton-associated protein 5
MGDSKDAIRARVKAIVRSLGSIYPSSKVFAALLEHGSRSKMARVRAESIEELGNLLQRQGMGVCQPGRALPELAALISDRDAASRSAALDAITQAYAQVGEDIFKYITNLQPKEQSMLDERLKRSQIGESSNTPKRAHSRQSMSRPDSRVETSRLGASSRLPGPASALRRQSALPGPSDQASRRNSQLPSTIQPVHSPEQAFTNLPIERMVTDERAPQHRARSASIEAHGPFAAVISRNTAQSVDALKVVQRRIAEDTQALIEQADALMEALTAQMAFAFQGLDKGTSQETLRLCKHLMQTLSSFFDQKALSLAVSKASLVKLLGELTKRLLETADSGASEAIVSLSKVLNMVLIRIFHNSDNSSCFG